MYKPSKYMDISLVENVFSDISNPLNIKLKSETKPFLFYSF